VSAVNQVVVSVLRDRRVPQVHGDGDSWLAVGGQHVVLASVSAQFSGTVRELVVLLVFIRVVTTVLLVVVLINVVFNLPFSVSLSGCARPSWPGTLSRPCSGCCSCSSEQVRRQLDVEFDIVASEVSISGHPKLEVLINIKIDVVVSS